MSDPSHEPLRDYAIIVAEDESNLLEYEHKNTEPEKLTKEEGDAKRLEKATPLRAPDTGAPTNHARSPPTRAASSVPPGPSPDQHLEHLLPQGPYVASLQDSLDLIHKGQQHILSKLEDTARGQTSRSKP